MLYGHCFSTLPKNNAIRKVQFHVYADDINTLGGRIHTIKNTQAIVTGKETGLEANADKTKVRCHVSVSQCRTKSQYKR